MSTPHSPETDLTYLASLLIDKSVPSDISDSELKQKLSYHGVTLLAAEFESLPASLDPYITQLKASMAANEALKQRELSRLFNALDNSDLKSVLFKGSALAYSIYPKPWLRPRSDSDVFIQPSDRKKFELVLAQHGYQKHFAIQGNYVSYQDTYSKALAGESSLNIDLHWRINNRQMFRQTFSVEELINRGNTLEQFEQATLNAPINIPGNIDSLLIASLHRAGHHNKEERLAWIYDIHLLASSLNNEQWQDLCNRAIAKKIAAITLNALETAQRYFNTHVNEGVLAQLASRTKSHEPSAIFLNRKLSERHYFWADIKSMPDFGSKLSFLRESVIPPPAYVRRQMNTPYASIAYVKRFIRGIRRIG